MDALSRYLVEQSEFVSAGQGQFTIDPGRQRRLLSEFGFSDSRLGLLKLAQAAVLSGTWELTFETGKELQIRFGLKRPLPVPWWSAVNARDHELDSCIALALLALSQAYEVNWSWRFCSEGWNGSVGQTDFTHLGGGGSGPDNTFVCQIKPIESPHWFHLRHWTSALKSWLSSRLEWMPIPVRWDGKYLNRLLRGGKLVDGKEFHGVGRLSKSAEAFLYCGEDESGDLWLPGRSFATYSNFRNTKPLQGGVHVDAARVAVKADGMPVYRGFAALGQHFNNWSETTFIRHGVTLEMHQDVLGCCAVAFVSAAGLQTDLSGLKLVRNAAFQERLDLLHPEVAWLNRHDFRPTE